MIVEDDTFSAKLYERLLRSVSYQNSVCVNYEETVEYLMENVPDIVVLDMRLEHYNSGPDILRMLRYQEKFKDTRIVIISAYSSMIDEYGEMADMVILKPLNAKELIVYAEEELAV